MDFEGIKLEWLHHSCFRVSNSKVIVYTDPYKVKNNYNDADIILITHDHYDHLDQESIKKLINDNTIIVAPEDCKKPLIDFNNKKVFVSPNQVKIINDVTIRTVLSYNLTKFSNNGKVFHPKEKGNVGYIFIVGDTRVYLAGDTDIIPEMKDYKTDIALLPVSGIYVMGAKEAANAAILIKPKIAVPMHYDSGIGTKEDAKEFKKLIENRISVMILNSVES
jgi:L-ascorbate metabolism protein UlaG (beta-lactamase superfamily)